MTSILINPRERIRFLKFAAVGTFGAVVDFGLANLLTKGFNAPLVVAGTLSFIAAILSNFLWNRYWTYPDSRSKTVLRQLAEFTVVNVMGLAIRIPILTFVEAPMIRFFAGLPVRLNCSSYFCTPKAQGANFTLAIAVLIVMFWNFFVNRYWTYADVN